MTAPFVAFAAGLFLIVVAIFGGSLEVKEVRVANLGPLPRVLSFVLGCALLAVFFLRPHWLEPSGPAQDKAVVATAEKELAKLKEELRTAHEQEQWRKDELQQVLEAVRRANAKATIESSKATELVGRAEAEAAQAKAALARKEAEERQQQAAVIQQQLQQIEQEVSDKERRRENLQNSVDRAHVAAIGYAIFSVIDTNNRQRKAYFLIDGRPDARFPVVDDVAQIAPGRDKVAIRARPFHWDATRGDAVKGEPSAYLMPGQKVRVGRDIYVATDPANHEQYVLFSIAESIGFDLLAEPVETSPLASARAIADGFVYVGKLDGDADRFLEKNFDNRTRPTALFPAPQDRLRALTGVNLRKVGPATAKFSEAEKIRELIAGQEVEVVGDVALTRSAEGGVSLWAPVQLVANSN